MLHNMHNFDGPMQKTQSNIFSAWRYHSVSDSLTDGTMYDKTNYDYDMYNEYWLCTIKLMS